MRLNLDYFYGSETGAFHFYRVPKALFNSGLSLEAAALYSLMLDRVGLSAKNGWMDSLGRVFIYFVQTDVQKYLRCGHNRATAFMRELERAGLIERKRQGLGKPAKIYVKNFCPCEGGASEPEAPETAEPARSREEAPPAQGGAAEAAGFMERDGASPRAERGGPGPGGKTARTGQSGAPLTGSPECPNRAANDTEKNETESSEPDPIPPQPHGARRRRPSYGRRLMDEMRLVREEIRENIDLEGLVWDEPCDSGLFEGYVELMTEACCSTRETIRLCGQELPADAVRRRFLTLNREHILYVRDSLRSVRGSIGNIKAYTLAALYNAPATMEQYYTALAGQDAFG